MKRNIIILCIGCCMAIASIFVVSCEKADNYYYDFDAVSTQYDGTILDYLEANRSVYDSMLITLDMVPSLRRQLGNSTSKITVFALTNRSFELAINAMNANRVISQKSLLYLQDLDKNFVDTLLSRYVFEGLYDTRFLSGYEEGIRLESLNYSYPMHLTYAVSPSSGFIYGGQDQITFSDINNSIFHRYWQSSRTNVVNIITQNGVIHVLSQGHNFGFNKLISEYN